MSRDIFAYFLMFHILIYQKINILSINNKNNNKKLQIYMYIMQNDDLFWQEINK